MKITYDCASKPRTFDVCSDCEKMLHESGFIVRHEGPWRLGHCEICDKKIMVFTAVECRKEKKR